MKGRIQRLQVANIICDPKTQMRVEWHEAVVAEYVDAMRKDEFPPPVVFTDGKDNWLADGWYRLAAHKAMKKSTVLCEMRKGGLEDAILYAAGANARHGLRRTNADKERAVRTILEKYQDKSAAWIGATCGVSHQFVLKVKERMGIKAELVKGTDGKQYPPKKGPPKKKNATKPPVVAPKKTVEFDPDEEIEEIDEDAANDALQQANAEDADETEVGTLPEKAAESEEVILDGAKNAVPKSLRHIFDPEHLLEFDAVQTKISELSKMIGILKAKKWGKRIDVSHINTYLTAIRDAVRNARPHATCKSCDGAGCADCNSDGWVLKKGS